MDDTNLLDFSVLGDDVPYSTLDRNFSKDGGKPMSELTRDWAVGGHINSAEFLKAFRMSCKIFPSYVRSTYCFLFKIL